MRPIDVKTGLDEQGPPEHLATLRLPELGRGQATATRRLRPIDQVLEAVADDRNAAPISVRVSLRHGVGQRVGRGQRHGR
jgi:hypothetical protein